MAESSSTTVSNPTSGNSGPFNGSISPVFSWSTIAVIGAVVLLGIWLWKRK